MANFVVRAIGVLILLTTLAVALSRAPDRSATSLVARWAPPPSDSIDVQDQIIRIRDEGPRHTGAKPQSDNDTDEGSGA
jgi:hypothetical protein